MATKTKKSQKKDSIVNIESQIVLYNDDVNTFDWVIHCLVIYCGHTTIQAEQCANIVHYKGKCVIKSGPISQLLAICNTLCQKGLSAIIQ